MALTLTTTPMLLYPDTYYDYSISLQGNSYIVEMIYNERSKLYYMNLYDSDRNPIFLGQALIPTYPIAIDYALTNLSGWFWLENNSALISEPYKTYPDSIDKYYKLYYSYIAS